MNSVKIDKIKLLAIVRENRTKHQEAYKEAREGYNEQLVSKLESLLKDAREGKKVANALGLVEPVCNLEDYDMAIRMLELSEDTVIDLEAHDFEQFVLDKWHWKKTFDGTVALYSKSGR